MKREKIKEFNSIKLFGSNKVRTFTYEISVRNTKKEALNVIVEDQLPVSQDKDIEVQVEEISGGNKNDETGKVSWKISLQPNETKKVRLSFSVKYPKNKNVSGL